MRILFAGTPSAAVPSLQRLLASGHEVVAVITQPDRPRGRGRSIQRGPVSVVAETEGLKLLQPEQINHEVGALATLAPDLAVIVGYGSILRRPVLDVPRLGWLNLHFSLLPAYRGAAPVQHALLNGDGITGATTFLLDEGMDTGPIVGQLTERIMDRDTTGTLLQRLADHGADLVLASVDALHDGTAMPQPQRPDGVSFAPKIDRATARVDWRLSGPILDRHVRAMSPEPGAWTLWRDEPYRIEAVSLIDHRSGLEPGQVRIDGGSVHVGVGDGVLCLEQIRPPGKRSMTGAQWARGLRESVQFQ